jgi:NAD(P)-dependent dehydrogenase (short-subunit alcohol dehydrogenase family)
MSSRLPVQSPTIFILSVSSDIGEQLALDYLRRGFQVLGTFRKNLPSSLLSEKYFCGLQCDVTSPECKNQLVEFFTSRNLHWDIFISCVGQLAPVGLFFENNFESWTQSVETNSVAQLRALHAVHPFRRPGQINHVVFFAGGGTNNPFRSYSAYCLGKIALIKMCELLDDENPDLNVFIVGTGWVRTKIHEQTLAAGALAGIGYDKTRQFMEQNTPGTSHGEISALISWGIEQGRAVAGGRNFSVVHDGWESGGSELAASLLADSNKFKLRRHSNSVAAAHSS